MWANIKSRQSTSLTAYLYLFMFYFAFYLSISWYLIFIFQAHHYLCTFHYLPNFLYSSFTSTLCYVFLCLTSTHSFYLSILSQFVHLLSKTFYRYILSLLVTCLSYWYTIFYTPVYLFGAHFYLCTLSAHVKLLTAVCTYLYF